MQAQQLDARLRAGQVQVIDVREPQEWQAGHLPGAVHLPLGDLPERLADLPGDTPVVVVCRSGTRSARAAALLRERGVAVANLEGGLRAWVAAGGRLQAADGGPGRVLEDDEPVAGVDVAALHRLLLELGQGLQERYGDAEPSEEQVREFLRERLRAEGRTDEEITRLLADLDD